MGMRACADILGRNYIPTPLKEFCQNYRLSGSVGQVDCSAVNVWVGHLHIGC